MDKMLHRPVMVPNPVTETLEEADACIVGAIQGHMPEHCESLEVEAVDRDGDGKKRIVIEVKAKP